MRWLFAAAVSAVVFVAVASSTFVPLQDSAGIDYLFAWPGARVLIVAASIASLLIATLFIVVHALAARASERADRLAREGRWIAPLVASGAIVIGILPAVPGIGEHASPLGYFFYDLRWWWLAVLVGWTAVNADEILGSPARRRLASPAGWPPAAKLLLMDGLVFCAVMASAIATTPQLRFIGVLHGDEPKYIRYCEVWYQGGGLDISKKALFSDEPLDSSPHLLRTAASLPRAIAEEARAFVDDLGHFARNPLHFQWNRAVGGNGFVQGKHGGIYEIYQPGLSAVLFPGYLIDRYLLGLHSGYQGEFPDELVMTNVMMLLVFGCCGVALFRLLRHLLASDSLALLWAAVGLTTLPTSAFAFQFYPELVALLILLIAANFLFVGAQTATVAQAIGVGAASGALGWLHPRFLLLSVAIAIVGAVRMHAQARRAFVAAYGLVLLSIMGFDYRVTGSWLPTARWDSVNTEGTLNGAAVPMNLVGYLFHRTWGVLPQCLLLLAAAPGVALLVRRAPRVVVTGVVFALCLAIPAAGHTLSAAAGTPGRLVLAVVPLFIWPVAAVVRRYWSSPAVRSAAVILGILSLETSTSYNWTHKKHLGPMHAAGMSGWRPNLMFPNVPVMLSEWSAASVVALTVFVLVLGVLSAAAVRRDGFQRVSADLTRSAWRACLTTVAAALLMFGALTATMGSWYHTEYLLDAGEAHHAAARALVNLDRCRLCFTSREGPVDWTSLNPNRVEAMAVDLSRSDRRLAMRVRLTGGDDHTARFGRIHVDFGDGEPARWSGIVDEGQYEHQYRQRGTYSVVTWLQLRDGRTQLDRRTITIDEAQSGG